MKKIINAIVILAAFTISILISGCSSEVYEKAKPNIYYKMDMIIEYDDNEYEGVAVLPSKNEYEIRFRSPGKMDLFTFRTCSREVAIEEAKFHGSSKRAVVNYIPTDLEKGFCPIDIGSFEKQKGRHAWGYVDIYTNSQSGGEGLPAEVICGSGKYISKGVSVCQQRETLIQSIKFNTDVIVSPDPGCELDNTEGKYFTFNIKKGFCIYAFMEKKEPHRIHRLTTYGYEKILLREG